MDRDYTFSQLMTPYNPGPRDTKQILLSGMRFNMMSICLVKTGRRYLDLLCPIKILYVDDTLITPYKAGTIDTKEIQLTEMRVSIM
jgi:hypothetical protein